MGEAVLEQAEQQRARRGATPPRGLSSQDPGPGVPLGVLANAGLEVTVALAAPWQLVLSHLVDGALVVAVGALVAWVDVWLLGPGWRPRGADWAGSVGNWLEAHEVTTIVALLVAAIAGSAHAVVASMRGGRTLGRLVSGTVLVHTTGRRLTVWRMLLRVAGAWGSLLCGGAGYYWVVLDRQRRTWHDRLAGTVLVKRHAAMPSGRLGS
ncbi:MAG: RDD family protein [Myxococcota bacterium]